MCSFGLMPRPTEQRGIYVYFSSHDLIVISYFSDANTDGQAEDIPYSSISFPIWHLYTEQKPLNYVFFFFLFFFFFT